MTRSSIPAEFQTQPAGITGPQKKFINDLLNDRDLSASEKVDTSGEGYESAIETIRAQVDSLTKRQASQWIEALLKFPKKPVQRAETTRDIVAEANPFRQGASYSIASNRNCPLPDVPAGRYAVEHEGVLKFYRVDKPTEGRWAGFTFLKVQASDELHPIKNFDYKRTILTEIAIDPKAASERYGQELGHCGICGRTLTDEESRAIGIGPVCRSNSDWY